ASAPRTDPPNPPRAPSPFPRASPPAPGRGSPPAGSSAARRRPRGGRFRGAWGREELEIELLIELGRLPLGRGGEQFGGHGGQHAVIAQRVIAQGGHELGG